MKKMLVVVLLGAMILGSMGGQAKAGDREWAVAGKVLTGLMVLNAITTACPTTTVVYEQPTCYAPPVVYRRPVVYVPRILYRQPVVYRRPVYRPPVYHQPPRPVVRRAHGPVYRDARRAPQPQGRTGRRSR